MPYLIGMILGDTLARIGFFRAAGAIIVLAATGLLAHRLVAANLDPAHAYIAAAAAPLVLFGWAIWHPAASRLRLWIVDGVYLAARLAMWWAGIAFAIGLVVAEFRIDHWLSQEWPQAATAAFFWLAQWALGAQVARSHRIMGERSVIEVDA
ncbi:hypothetical protein [Sphingomonas parapaucimobilis]|uniref:hypothetical protein n=1 Tax=Sphingomonas parapaucimobilis TaxID=28213 RepID=UPI0035C7C3EC